MKKQIERDGGIVKGKEGKAKKNLKNEKKPWGERGGGGIKREMGGGRRAGWNLSWIWLDEPLSMLTN